MNPSTQPDSRTTRPLAGVAALALALAACTEGSEPPTPAAESDGGSGDGDGDGSAGRDSGNDEADSTGADAPGPDEPAPAHRAPLRRLTAAQYRAVVEQQLGVDAAALSLPADGRVGPFVGNAETPLSGLHIDQYFAAANEISEQVELPALHPCGEAPHDDCAPDFIDEVGAVLMRRPVSAEDHGRLREVYDVARAAHPPEHALRRVIAALLQSPYMLYHVEIGIPADPEDTARRLDGYELANRLSFLLWNRAPDAALRQAAAGGELDAPEGIRAQAARMLDDPRAAAQLGSFHLQWLGAGGLAYLVKDAERYPLWSDPAVREDLRQEIVDFSSFVVLESDGTAGDLVTASFSFLRGDLFRIYGVVEPAGHDPAVPIGLDPERRSGLLTMAGVLASHASAAQTSPVHRGLMVLENLLCVDIASPPPGLDTSPPEPDADEPRTRRELLEQHEQDPACGVCHVTIDPPGLLFEHYDAVGAWRDEDFDYPGEIDTAVVLATGTDVEGPMASPPELGAALAQSEDYRRCVIRQWARFGLGRELTSGDQAALDQLDALAADDVVVRDLILDLVVSEPFRYRPRHATR